MKFLSNKLPNPTLIYTHTKLIEQLLNTDWNINFDSVQSYWNCFESKLIEITDLVAPLELIKDKTLSKFSPPRAIKNKINKRSRLLKKIKTNPNPANVRLEIKTLNNEIKSYFHKLKSKNICKGLINPQNHANAFAKYFHNKVNLIVNQTHIDPGVYVEIVSLLTTNLYSILFYYSEVWHLPNLKTPLKQVLLSASAKALKLSQRTPDPFESFINIHKSCNRASPEQMIVYKHAILLHKLYNTHQPQTDWIELNFNQILTSRQKHFQAIKNNNFNVGFNLLATRLSVLNGKVLLDDLNLLLESYKVKYKQILLKIP